MSRVLSVGLCWLALLLSSSWAWPPRLDAQGDPLSAGCVARLGTVRWRHPATVQFVSFSRDGQTIYSSSQDQSTRAWEAHSGKERGALPALQGSYFVRQSLDGKTIAGVKRNAITFQPLPEGKAQTLVQDCGHVSAFALAPDGKTFALGDMSSLSGEMNPIEVRDLRGTLLWKTPAHGGGVRSLAIHPAGKVIASGGADGQIRLWDWASGKESDRPRFADAQQGAVMDLAFSLDGRHLVSAGTDLVIWDAMTGKVLHRVPAHRGGVVGVGVSPDGSRVASVGVDRQVRLWETRSGRALWERGILTSIGHGSPVFSPDGRTIVLVDGRQTLSLHDAETGRPLNASDGHTGYIAQLDFSPDGKTLATAEGYGDVLVWQVGTWKLIHRFKLAGTCGGLAYSPDGQTLGVAATDGLSGSIHLWDLQSGKEKARLSVGGSFGLGWHVLEMAFSADGRRLTAQTGSGVQAWDVATGKKIPTSDRGREDYLLAGLKVLSPDGQFSAELTTKGWERIRQQAFTGMGVQPWMRFPITQSLTVRETASGVSLCRFTTEYQTEARGAWLPGGDLVSRGQASVVRGPTLAFSPDGRLLFTRSGRASLLRDLASGELLWNEPERAPEGVRFSADGRTLILAWSTGKVSLWDALTGKERGTWSASGMCLHALSPDGRWLATGHTDTTVLVWDLLEMARLERQARPASESELEQLWTDLGGEVKQAYRAMDRLARTPAAVEFLRQRLRPGLTLVEERASRLVEDLNSRKFSTREAAARDLRQLGSEARQVLAGVLNQKPTLEVRRRIEEILDGPELPGRLINGEESLRRWRAVQVLEWTRSAEAHKVLDTLTEGPVASLVTIQARASVERLKAAGWR